MMRVQYSQGYENWAPVVARVLFGLSFLLSAYYKIPGSDMFYMQVGMSGEAGIPLPLIAVTLAFILELVGGLALVIGWQARTFAMLLAGFVILVALFFYRDWSDQMTMGLFISCLLQASGLLYISVYGAQHMAVKKDDLPQGMTSMRMSL